MNKHYGIFGIVCCMILCAFFLAACSDKAEKKAPEPSEISYVSIDDETEQSIRDTAASYLAAVKKHDHTALTMFTTSDFDMNYNETGFFEYCRDISDFSVKEIDIIHVIKSEDKYYVPVTYSLTYSAPFSDDNGADYDAGEYTYYAYFIMKKDNKSYRICDITDRASG